MKKLNQTELMQLVQNRIDNIIDSAISLKKLDLDYLNESLKMNPFYKKLDIVAKREINNYKKEKINMFFRDCHKIFFRLSNKINF